MNDAYIEKDVIYPPTKEQIEDLRTHHVGFGYGACFGNLRFYKQTRSFCC
jgi:hypothetical protein